MNNSTNSLNSIHEQYDPFKVSIKKNPLRVFPLSSCNEVIITQNTNENQYDPLEMPCKIKTSKLNPIEIPVSPNYNTESDEFCIFNEFNFNRNRENDEFPMLRSPLNGAKFNPNKESEEFSMLRPPMNGYNNNDHVWFDFHMECRKMKYENLSKLVAKVKDDLEKMGWFQLSYFKSKVFVFLNKFYQFCFKKAKRLQCGKKTKRSCEDQLRGLLG